MSLSHNTGLVEWHDPDDSSDSDDSLLLDLWYQDCADWDDTSVMANYGSDDDDHPPLKKLRIRGKTKDPTCFPIKTPKPKTMTRRSSEVLGEKCGMSGIHVRRGLRLGIPMWIFTCMVVLFSNPKIDCTQRYEAMKCYAGAATIYNAFIDRGFNAAKLDKSYSNKPEFDFCTLQGFVNLIWHMMCLKYRGLNFHAVVCSTWIFMSMASTGRTHARPRGNLKSPAVVAANLMVSRMCLIIRLGAARFCRWAVEQPATSCLPNFHRVRALRTEAENLMCGRTNLIRTNMKAFGGPTLKPTLIIGNPWVSRLVRAAPTGWTSSVNLVVKSVDKHGQRRVTGNGKKLKESQEYPPAFGRAVCQHFMESSSPATAWSMDDYDVDETDDERDTWSDALDGHSIAELLTVAKNFKVPRA